MRLKFITLIAFGLVSCSLFASSERRAVWREKNPNLFSMTFSYGGSPIVTGNYFNDGYAFINEDDYACRSLSSLYSDSQGKIMTAGVVSGEFNWNFSRWGNASVLMGLCPVWSSTIDAMTDEKKSGSFGMAILVMPKIKVMYCNTPLIRVYSALALGMGAYPGFKNMSVPVRLEAQFSLVGMEIGKKYFGSFELGAGTLYVGGQIGFGFKF